LITYLINARIDGRPLSDEHVNGSLILLLIAGIATTWSAIGSCLWHLAMHPNDRRRLAPDPDLIPTAVEEFLRAYASATVAREVVKETEINGCVFKPGQMVVLSFGAANRDPDKFPDADRVVIDRPKNPHVAFGLGIHRCIGSNLARMEINVALQSGWLASRNSDSIRQSRSNGRRGRTVDHDGSRCCSIEPKKPRRAKRHRS
jgi:cytochrome P450